MSSGRNRAWSCCSLARTGRGAVLLALLGFPAVALFCLALWFASRKEPTAAIGPAASEAGNSSPRDVVPPSIAVPEPAPAAPNPSSPKRTDDSRFRLEPDQGQLPWGPPTHSGPIALRGCPPGGQAFLYVRPANLWKLAEGKRVLRALGQAGPSFEKWWNATIQVPLSDVEVAIATFIPRKSMRMESVWSITLRGDANVSTPWHSSAPKQVNAAGSIRSWSGDPWGLMKLETDHLVFGPPQVLQDMAIAAKGGPILRRDLERLLATSERDHQFTLLFTPTFVLHEGRPLLMSVSTGLPDVVDELFGQGVSAVACSAYLHDDELYLELQIAAALEARAEVVRKLEGRLQKLPEEANRALQHASVHDYWRPVVSRLPEMLSFTVQQTRIGVESGVIVANVSLPAAAAHNLLLGRASQLSRPAASDVNPGSTTHSRAGPHP